VPGNQRQDATAANDSALDETDRRIVVEIQEDARLTMAELGRRVGLSAPAVTERLGRLEQRGVIRGYHADVDPRALGLSLGAVVRIRPSPGQLQNVAEAAAATPEVVECHRITGEDCFLVKVHATDLNSFEEVLDRFLLYGQTTTSIVQSTPVPPRTPGLTVR
jgi:Lrp/AsnC family leucine-responsive transcriptional regulator